MFRSMLRPGQGFRRFTVLARSGGITASGRPVTSKLKPVSKITGIITRALQKEKEQFKQAGHPITHKVIQRGTDGRANVNDVLEFVEVDGKVRHFLIRGVHDPVELGHFTTYYTEERLDLQ